MERICKVSGKKYAITDGDLEFYKKMGVITDSDHRGLPTFCPEERQRRRLAWRNERNLYHRICDGSGETIISLYSPDSKFLVYENSYWWGDDWDGENYGISFDFSRSFFGQFKDFFSKVPKMARVQQGENENSKFCNCSSWNRDSYLIFTSSANRDCLYGNSLDKCEDSVDNLFLVNSELCYGNINVAHSYNLKFSQNSDNCSDSWFLKDCVGCKNCFGCVNLRNKEYYFLNERCTREEYEKKLHNLNLTGFRSLRNLYEKFFGEFVKKFPVKFMTYLQNQNCSGDLVFYSKHALDCFDCKNVEDSRFCDSVFSLKNSYDVSFYGCGDKANELLYECEAVGNGIYNVKFSKMCWGGCVNLDYCYECFKCEDCFGCVGLKNAKYCIFNKQYSEEDYFELRGKIIEHMKETGEWGEFFPMEMSPFGYNETVAQEYFPVEGPVGAPLLVAYDRENILEKGQLQDLPLQNLKYNWVEEKTSTKYEGPQYEIPDDIKDVDDDILQAILTCEKSGKNYRIVRPELDFYRKMNLPIPRLCPDERHRERMNLRNPRQLWERVCDNDGCDVKFQTTFAPDRPEKVFCEKCYQDVVD